VSHTRNHSPGRIGSTSLALALVSMLTVQLPAAPVDLNRALSEGLAAYRDKNYDKAIESLASIIKASPDGAPESVLYTLGFAYYFQLRHQDAADTFLAYLKKYPDSQNSAEVHLILGRSLLEIDGKAEDALVHLAKAAE